MKASLRSTFAVLVLGGLVLAAARPLAAKASPPQNSPPQNQPPQSQPSAQPQPASAPASPQPAAAPGSGSPSGSDVQTSAAPQNSPEQPHGEVLFQSHGEPPSATPGEADTAAPPTGQAGPPPAAADGPTVTDAERSAILFTAYDLDAHLNPAEAGLSVRARVTVRNTGSQPLLRIALQISSTLHWESASLITSGPQGTPVRLALAQHLLDTDADHTGQANEVILTLPSPLPPQASLNLDLFYEGRITASAGRLERIGASSGQGLGSDWDAIGGGALESGSSGSGNSGSGNSGRAPAQGEDLEAALRGFGNVLWYPVAEPQLFLGDGAELFHAIDQTRLREQDATMHLRLSVEYHGDPPTAAYFCGLRQPMVAVTDTADAPVASGHGIASAEFASQPIGFRLPSLFVVERPETLLADLPGSSSGAATGAKPGPAGAATMAPTAPSGSQEVTESASGGTPMLAVDTSDDGVLPRLADSAQTVAPLLQQWFGPRPLSALTILDHPGQPFEDGPLLVAPLASLASSAEAGALAHSLTHAWVQTGQAWMDEGLAEFISLVWVEQQKGRAAADAQLDDLVQPLSLAEPDFSRPTPPSTAPPSTAPPSAAPPSAASPGTSGPAQSSSAQPSDPTSSSSTAAAAPKSTSASASSSSDGGTAPEPLGQPLTGASEAFYYRLKAAAVWWMLRDIAGDDPLRFALSAWRTQPASHDSPQVQAENFEKLLEKTSGKDLAWFFNDWVLHDRGLPDLSITDVTPRELPAGKGHDTGWLIAVTIRNDGAAAAEVPVVIRSGTFSTTRRVRIAGFGSSTERIVVEAPPTQVLVNDGSVPEVRSSTHAVAVVARNP